MIKSIEKLKDAIIVRKTGKITPDELAPIIFELKYEVIDNPIHDYIEQYILKIVLAIEFECKANNPEMYNGALENATNQLRYFLYKDIVDMIPQLYSAAYSGERKEIFERIKELEHLVNYGII